MGYFSNGTEGGDYFETYCARCIHNDETDGCPVWDAHLIYNYRDCNEPTSILHMLIPRSENGLFNEKCLMFVEVSAIGDLLDPKETP